MKAKLIKEVDFYGLKIEGKIIGLSNNSTNNLFNYPFKLSLKNCEAIANDYDLDEIIEQTKLTLEDSRISSYDSFRIGMETILEILADKKFSEDDLREAISQTRKGMLYNKKYEDEYIQSLQQTEWDVIMEMEYKGFEEDGKLKEAYLPKLDVDGCLILKRK